MFLSSYVFTSQWHLDAFFIDHALHSKKLFLDGLINLQFSPNNTKLVIRLKLINFEKYLSDCSTDNM